MDECYHLHERWQKLEVTVYYVVLKNDIMSKWTEEELYSLGNMRKKHKVQSHTHTTRLHSHPYVYRSMACS